MSPVFIRQPLLRQTLRYSTPTGRSVLNAAANVGLCYHSAYK